VGNKTEIMQHVLKIQYISLCKWIELLSWGVFYMYSHANVSRVEVNAYGDKGKQWKSQSGCKVPGQRFKTQNVLNMKQKLTIQPECSVCGNAI
jgi:hypothetical protein